MTQRPPLSDALSHALKLRCPSCGRRKLYQRYLKQIDTCSECNAVWKDINVADAAAWLVMVVVSFIAAPLGAYLAMATDWSVWFIITLSSAASIIAALAALPFAKAVFMAWIWCKDAGDR